MQAHDVHARVECLLGEPVRYATVKATLAGNLAGPDPRFVRVARGLYRVAPPRPDPVTQRNRGHIEVAVDSRGLR